MFLIAFSAFGQNWTGALRKSYFANHHTIPAQGLAVAYDFGSYANGSTSQSVVNLALPGTYDLQRGSQVGSDGNDFSFTGTAARFDGTDDYGVVAGSNPLNFTYSDAVSIMSVIKFANNNDQQAIFSKQMNGPPYSGYDLYTHLGNLLWEVTGAYPGNQAQIKSQSSLGTSWVNVCGTYPGNNSGNGMKMYKNGEVLPFDVTVDSLTSFSGTSIGPEVGARDGNANRINGDVSQTLIYTRVLTPADVWKINVALKWQNKVRGGPSW